MERVTPAPPHCGTRSFLSLPILCTNRKLHLEHKARAGQVKRSGGPEVPGKDCECWGVTGGLLAIRLQVGRRRGGNRGLGSSNW